MLYYLSSTRLPSRKAHVIQQLRMCEAFSAVGEDVTFVTPRSGRERFSWEDIADFYGLSTRFKVATVPTRSEDYSFSIPYVPNLDSQVVTYWLLIKYITRQIESGDVIYSRNLYPTRFFLRILGEFGLGDEISVWFEQHQVDRDTTARFYEQLDGVVCISNSMKRTLVQERPVDPANVFVEHDGVNLQAYDERSKASARRELGIDPDEHVVAYTGHLYPSKDVERLVEAAATFDARCYIVGGYPEDVSRIQTSMDVPDTVTFTGFVPPSKAPTYQIAADVLVATVAPDPEMDYFSPLKLFEYMAARKPIVVTRKPDYEEILTDKETALFVEPGSTEDLANAVETLLADHTLRENLGQLAREHVRQYSWEQRAERILTAIRARSKERECPPQPAQ